MLYGDYLKSKGFIAWQPSTWPEPRDSYDSEFKDTLRIIFEESLISEINNVIKDAPTLEHRGHVVALSILCAIDTLSSYAFKDLKSKPCKKCGRGDNVGRRYQKYIENFFPREYQPFAKKIYKLYRNSITHSWNLFEAGMTPDAQRITEINGVINLGLFDFFTALAFSLNNFMERLKVDTVLQTTALARYSELKRTARP